MRYFLKSIVSGSFWRYALFSRGGIASFLASLGMLYLFMEVMDFLSIYTKDKYSKFALIPMAVISLIYVIVSRRPLTRFVYKVPGRDIRVEVKIGNLLEEKADIVISSNTTFDTDMSNGLISPESLQGQFALKFFQGNIAEIDRQLEIGLASSAGTARSNAPGKSQEFPMGEVAKVETHSKIFYFVAMSRLNDHGTASSTVRGIEDALGGLWTFIANQGELRDIAMPVLGTGRGRLDMPRKKMIERIAQSFSDASAGSIFSARLILVIRPEDAENFGVNLFEIRDYLVRGLHT